MPTTPTIYTVGVRLRGTNINKVKMRVRNTRTKEYQELTMDNLGNSQCNLSPTNSSFPSGFAIGDLIEIFRADGNEYVYTTFTVDNKAGKQLTLQSTAKSSTTHPSITI